MISNAYANKILQHICGVSAIGTLPSSLYLGLCKTAPNAATGAVTSEPTAASYERVVVGGSSTSGDKKFGSATGGIITNTTEIQFKTARQAWGDLAYFFLSESSTGNAIVWGEITGGVTVGAETVPTFYENELKISLDVALS